MKRTILLVMLVSCAAALIFAQGYSEGPRSNQEEPPQFSQRPDNMRGRDFSPRQRDGKERPVRRTEGDEAGNQRSRRNRISPPENASVSGNLSLVRGMIAVTEGDTTYIAGGLNRFIGFIDGLTEGAAVTLEGNVFSSPRSESVKFLFVQKMTLNEKEYDLGRPVPAGNLWTEGLRPQLRRQAPNFQNQRHHQMPWQMPQRMHRGRW